MLEVAPLSVTVPIYLSIWRAVLGCVSHSIYVAGSTGVGKSELAALAQQHVGPELDARNLPGSCLSTANALEAQAFALKDSIFVVDDFAQMVRRRKCSGNNARSADYFVRKVIKQAALECVPMQHSGRSNDLVHP